MVPSLPATVSRRRLGAALMGVSVAVVVLSLVVSAAFAPPVSKTPDEPNGDNWKSNRTIVGVQSTTTHGRVVALDAAGNARWKYGNAASYHDVTPLPNGTVLTAFVDHDNRNCGPYESPCSRTGLRVIDPDPKPHVVYEWTFPVRTSKNSEVHDVELLPSGEFLVADMDRERVFTLASNGTVTWQWNASEYYASPADPTRTDWLHINDVDRVEDGRYLVSVRNANQLVFVEPGEGVTEVVNEDRDWKLLNKQHNPQYVGEDTILVADSENDRVVELHRKNGSGGSGGSDGGTGGDGGESAKSDDGGTVKSDEWTVAWQVRKAGGIHFDWPRDADRLPNGNTLVTDSRNNRVVEVNESGDVVWSARVPTVPYEADRAPGEYPAGDRYNASDDALVVADDQTKLPVFAYLLASARHVVALPHWLTGWHLLVCCLGLVTFLAGAALFVRGDASD